MYVVYDRAGKEKLGEHADKKDAMRQLAATRLSEARRITSITSI